MVGGGGGGGTIWKSEERNMCRSQISKERKLISAWKPHTTAKT